MVELFDIMEMKDVEEERINEGIKTLFDFEEDVDKKTKTDLSNNEIIGLTRLKIIAEMLDIDILNKLCDNLCLFKVSKNRLGRSEIVKITHPEREDKEKSADLLQKLFNK